MWRRFHDWPPRGRLGECTLIEKSLPYTPVEEASADAVREAHDDFFKTLPSLRAPAERRGEVGIRDSLERELPRDESLGARKPDICVSANAVEVNSTRTDLDGGASSWRDVQKCISDADRAEDGVFANRRRFYGNLTLDGTRAD